MALLNKGFKLFTYFYPLYVIKIIRDAQSASKPDEEHGHGE
jgi:hypothetical protein